MQSTARCANCGCGEFEYEPPIRHVLQIPGGYKGPAHKTFTFGLHPGGWGEPEIDGTPARSDRQDGGGHKGWPIVDNYVPRLCCTACGYWEKTWQATGEGSPQRAGADQAMGSAGHVPGNMVPAQDERDWWLTPRPWRLTPEGWVL